MAENFNKRGDDMALTIEERVLKLKRQSDADQRQARLDAKRADDARLLAQAQAEARREAHAQHKAVMHAAEDAERQNDPTMTLSYTFGGEALRVNVQDITSGDAVRRQSTIFNLGRVLHGINLHRSRVIAQVRARAIGKEIAEQPWPLKKLVLFLADETRHAGDSITFEITRVKAAKK